MRSLACKFKVEQFQSLRIVKPFQGWNCIINLWLYSSLYRTSFTTFWNHISFVFPSQGKPSGNCCWFELNLLAKEAVWDWVSFIRSMASMAACKFAPHESIAFYPKGNRQHNFSRFPHRRARYVVFWTETDPRGETNRSSRLMRMKGGVSPIAIYVRGFNASFSL